MAHPLANPESPLNRWRERHQLTAAQLSERWGVTPQMVHHLLAGRRRPGQGRLLSVIMQDTGLTYEELSVIPVKEFEERRRREEAAARKRKARRNGRHG